MKTRSKNLKLAVILTSLFAVCLAGCGKNVNDFFDKKAIEVHSRDIIREVSQIPVIPDANNAIPNLYLAPPEIKTFNPQDTKLYYFTRNHTPDKLSDLIKVQLGYDVSINPATNQLIVKCPTTQDATIALEFLQMIDVPPIQVRIDCLISEMFADATLDWETSLAINDLFGNGDHGVRTVGDAIAETISLKGGGTNNLAFPGAASRDTSRGLAGLQVGLASNSSFSAVIDMLSAKGYLKIVMNPTLRTVNGKVAKITTKDQVPITKTVTDKDADPYEITEYVPVTDSLEVTPYVYADGSIGLRTKAMIGSKSTPEGSSQKTIITSREIDIEENRIRPGDSLVIGGIRKSETLGIARGVPGLEDLPLLGVMFSSKDREEKVKEVMFILTPSISSAGVDSEVMLERIRQKHENPDLKKGMMQNIIDPFDKSEYTKHIEKKASESETARIKAETITQTVREQNIQIEAQAKAEKAEAEKIKAQAQLAEAQAAKTHAEAEMIKAQAQGDKAAAAKAQAEAEQAKAKAADAQANAQKLQAEAETAKAQADAAKADAEKIQALADKAKADAENSKSQAQQALAEAEKAKADAENAKAMAEHEKAEAQNAKVMAEQEKAEAAKAKAEAQLLIDANRPDPNNTSHQTIVIASSSPDVNQPDSNQPQDPNK